MRLTPAEELNLRGQALEAAVSVAGEGEYEHVTVCRAQAYFDFLMEPFERQVVDTPPAEAPPSVPALVLVGYRGHQRGGDRYGTLH